MPQKTARHRKKVTKKAVVSTTMTRAPLKRASIFRNGGNQSVRLPQELRFAEQVTEVWVRKQGDGLLLSPVRPDWSSFFALPVEVTEGFLADRRDMLPQSREPR